MKANEIKFGIEIEAILPANAVTFNVGGYHRGLPLTGIEAAKYGNEYWKAESDSSIRAGRGERGVEFVSPVLKGVEGMISVLTMLEWLNSIGARVNRSCGLHVTTTFPVYDIKAMKRLVHFVARHEDALFAATGSVWRAEQCMYTSKIKDKFSPVKDLRSRRQFEAAEHAIGDRYAALNLTHALRGRERVEFRVFAGTLNAAKMRGYIQLVLGIIERCTESNRTAQWDRVAPHWIKNLKCEGKGEGHVALWQLMSELAWVHYHNKAPMGLLETKAASKDVRKALFKMADKFDRDSAC